MAGEKFLQSNPVPVTYFSLMRTPLAISCTVTFARISIHCRTEISLSVSLLFFISNVCGSLPNWQIRSIVAVCPLLAARYGSGPGVLVLSCDGLVIWLMNPESRDVIRLVGGSWHPVRSASIRAQALGGTLGGPLIGAFFALGPVALTKMVVSALKNGRPEMGKDALPHDRPSTGRGDRSMSSLQNHLVL